MVLGLPGLAVAGMMVRAARDAGLFGIRTRLSAWRWGPDLRVASCCLEHAGQTSGVHARPGPPGSPLIFPSVKHEEAAVSRPQVIG